MLERHLPLARLSSQNIGRRGLRSPAEVVRRMVAMQAQDFPMSRWAVGVRLPGSTEQAVLAALDAGAVIRTHLLRPTWHVAAAGDVRWLLRLSAAAIKSRTSYRDRQLELTGALYARSNRLLEKELRGGAHLTRDELVRALRDARIPVDENRASHLLMRAELDEVICSGALRGGRVTYALLDLRLPPSPPLRREEALAALAARYFESRGPASAEDFAWWAGLGSRDARRAVEAVRGSLAVLQVGSRQYFASGDGASAGRGRPGVLLLPAYDELMISYADRTAMLGGTSEKKTVSSNGIFYPIVAEGGRVIGRWTRRSLPGIVDIQVTLFGRPRAAVRDGIEAARARLERFWNVKTRLDIHSS